MFRANLLTEEDVTVSVVCAVKDRISLLDRCLYSWSHQTYPKLEFVVVDDGSKGKNEVEKMSKSYFPNVKIVRLERGKDRTPAVSWNKGFEVCTGEFVLFTGGDTILSNYNAIQHILNSYVEDRVSVLTYFLSEEHTASLDVIDWKKDPKIIETLPGFWDFRLSYHYTTNRQNLAAGLTTYVTGQSRKAWEYLGLFREEEYHLGSDQDLHLREKVLGKDCITVGGLVAYHQWHPKPDVTAGSSFIYTTKEQARLLEDAAREGT